MSTAQRLIIDTERSSLIGTFSSITGTTNPTFVLGDTCPVEIFLVKQYGNNSPLSNIPFPPGAVVRCAIGLINLQPTSGTWSVGYNGSIVTGLSHDISAEDLQTALNGVATISAAGGVTVDKVAAQYRLTWNTTGDKLSFYPGSNTLVPASDLQISTLQQGGGSTNEVVMLNLAARPISLETTFEDTNPVSGSFTSDTFTISGQPRSGGFRLQLSFKQDTVKTVWTDAILVSSNTTMMAQAIFQALVNVGWGTISGNATVNAWGVLVTELDGNSFRVDITNPQFTTPVVQIAPTIINIDVSEVTSLEGKTGVLSLNTVEAVAFLGTDESRRAILEVEVSSGDEAQTLLQANCTLVGQVIYAGTFSPIQLDTPMSEAVANNRFLRRDADQTLDSSTKNQMWENLVGVSSPAGEDIVGALVGAVTPSASNPFLTASEVDIFNQNLNTTDAVAFAGVNAGVLEASSATVSGETKTGSFKISDGTLPDKLFISTAGVITSTTSASFTSVNIPGPSSALDTVLSLDALSFQGNVVVSPSNLYLNDTVNSVSMGATGITFTAEASIVIGGIATLTASSLNLQNLVPSTTLTLDALAGIGFPDGTVQATRTVRENQVNGSGFSVGGFDTAHYPNEVKVIDDQGNAWWVAARPA